MAKIIKKKTKAKTKAKTKTKAKAKTKTKTKVKAKPKTKAKTKVKAKRKATTKRKVAAKPKAKAKTKKKTQAKKVMKKVAKKAKPKAPKTMYEVIAEQNSKAKFSEGQKAELLSLIEKIVNLRKREMDGLRSFEPIDRILDKYNQRYTDTASKFDAIVKYGMEKDPAFLPEDTFIFMNERREGETALYNLLEEIWRGNIRFDNAKEKMTNIYMNWLKEKSF